MLFLAGIFPEDEIRRKSFHLLILVYIFAYWAFPFKPVMTAMGVLLAVVITGEILRLKFRGFNEFILKFLGGVHRPDEEGKVSGLPWTLSGSYATMLCFHDRKIVIASLLFLAFGDTAAALFGKSFGKHKIAFEKTLEGTLACFAVCFVIGLLFFDIKIAILGALAMSVIELVPWPLNDNFWIPFLTAMVITFASK
jgi:dolichol kinase